MDEGRVVQRGAVPVRAVPSRRLRRANNERFAESARRPSRRSRTEQQIVVADAGEEGHELQPDDNDEEYDEEMGAQEEGERDPRQRGPQRRLLTPSRKLSDRSGLRQRESGSSIGTLSLSTRSLNSPQGVRMVAMGPGRSRPSSKASLTLSPGSRAGSSYLNTLEEDNRESGPRPLRHAHSSSAADLEDESAAAAGEGDESMRLRPLSVGGGRGGRARPLRRSQGLLVAASGGTGSIGSPSVRISREEMLSPAGAIAEDEEYTQDPRQSQHTAHTWPRQGGRGQRPSSSVSTGARQRSSTSPRIQLLEGAANGEDMLEAEDVDQYEDEYEEKKALEDGANEERQQYRRARGPGAAAAQSRTSPATREQQQRNARVKSVRESGTNEDVPDAFDDMADETIYQDPSFTSGQTGNRIGGRRPTRTSGTTRARGPRVGDGDIEMQGSGGGEDRDNGDLVSLSSGGQSGRGASRRSRGAVAGDVDGAAAVQVAVPQFVEGGGGGADGEWGALLEHTAGGEGEESAQESELAASPPATARSADSGYGPTRRPQPSPVHQKKQSPGDELGAGAGGRFENSTMSQEELHFAGIRADTKWSGLAAQQQLNELHGLSSGESGGVSSVGVLARSATDERYSQAGEQLDESEDQSISNSRYRIFLVSSHQYF